MKYSRTLKRGMAFLPFLIAHQAAATEMTTQKETMVVSASGFMQALKEAPASISVISRTELEQRSVQSLADALRDVEGIDVLSDTGKTGGLRISIRGMPSEYTLILIDGKRQNSASNVTPNGFNETATSFLPPVNAIERIEVIRGPMSTLYGSDAIGGVVNIITRKIPHGWSTSANVNHLLQQNSQSGTVSSVSIYTAGELIEDKLGLMLNGRIYRRDASHLTSSNSPYVISTRGPSPTESFNYSFGGRLSYSVTPDHLLWLDIDNASQWYDNSKAQLGGLKGNGYAKSQRYQRKQSSLNHQMTLDNGISGHSSLMYNQTETIGRLIPAPSVTWNPRFVVNAPRELNNKEWVLDSKWVVPVVESHKVTVGGQWRYMQFMDSIITRKLSQTAYATFVEDEWRVLNQWSMTFGGRYDHHQTFGSHFSPRIYSVWDISPHVTLKGGVGKGYKTPNVEYLVDGVNNITRQGYDIMLGNSCLKPESSVNYELGLYVELDSGFSSSITYFHNEFKDKIEGRQYKNVHYTGKPFKRSKGVTESLDFAGAPVTQELLNRRENLDKASSHGIEFATKIPLSDALDFTLNYTYTKSKQKSGDNRGLPLNHVPKHMVNTRLSWQATPHLTPWISAAYRQGAIRFKSVGLTSIQSAEKDRFGDTFKSSVVFNLGTNYVVNENVTFNATIYNLLNKDFLKYYPINDGTSEAYVNSYVGSGRSSSGNIQEGRRLWLSVDFTF